MTNESETVVRIQKLLHAHVSEERTFELKSAVVDLLHEVEVLNLKLAESRQESAALRKQVASAKARDDLRKELKKAASKGQLQICAPLSPEKAETLDGEEASLMTITSLANRVEELSARNSRLVLERLQLMENLEDLEYKSQAKDVKIQKLLECNEDLECEGEAKTVTIKTLQSQLKKSASGRSVSQPRPRLLTTHLEGGGGRGSSTRSKNNISSSSLSDSSSSSLFLTGPESSE